MVVVTSCSTPPTAGTNPDTTGAAAAGVDPLSNLDGTRPGLGAVPTSQLPQAQALLRSVPTAPLGSFAGYDRSCAPGRGCVFGPAWTDTATGVPWAGDHCSTREQVLRRDSVGPVQYRAGSDCVVTTAVIADPYTGHLVPFSRWHAIDVEVDHVYPLALSWRMGASSWPLQKRIAFANDPLNLLPTARAVNEAKSDSGPAAWLPPNAKVRCAYAVRIAQVAGKYGLPLTAADQSAALSQCPGQP